MERPIKCHRGLRECNEILSPKLQSAGLASG